MRIWIRRTDPDKYNCAFCGAAVLLVRRIYPGDLAGPWACWRHRRAARRVGPTGPRSD